MPKWEYLICENCSHLLTSYHFLNNPLICNSCLLVKGLPNDKQ